jgi:hypothetical protein
VLRQFLHDVALRQNTDDAAIGPGDNQCADLALGQELDRGCHAPFGPRSIVSQQSSPAKSSTPFAVRRSMISWRLLGPAPGGDACAVAALQPLRGARSISAAVVADAADASGAGRPTTSAG